MNGVFGPSLSGAQASLNRQDVTANNLANATTLAANLQAIRAQDEMLGEILDLRG